MGHDWRIVDFGGPVLGWWSWTTLLVVGLIVLLAGLLIVTVTAHQDEPGHSEAEREVFANMDGQIRSMLLQSGGELTQDQIRANLSVALVDVSRELAELEKRGEIGREWLPFEYTFRIYLVELAPASPAPAGGPSVQPSS